MKTQFRFFRFTPLLIVLAVLMSSCRGDEGPAGPPGNANVITIQFEVYPGDWSGNLDGYMATLNVRELNNDIYNNAAVLVYRMNDDLNPKYLNMLPYTWVNNGVVEYMDAEYYVGSIDIIYRLVENGINNTPAPSIVHYYKVVIAEGNLIASAKNEIDVSNYSLVKAYFKLPN